MVSDSSQVIVRPPSKLFVPDSLPPFRGAQRVALHSMIRLTCEANLLAVADVLSLSPTEVRGGNGRRRRTLHDFSHVNGGREQSERFVALFETLTSQTGLMELTLRELNQVIGMDGLAVATCKRWCAACYQVDLEGGTSVYDRLLWSIKVIDRCPIHRIPLVDACRCCGYARFPVMSTDEISGFCPKCRIWLGERAPHAGSMDDAARYSCWVAQALSELLESKPSPTDDVQPKFAQALRKLANEHHEGTMSHLARQIGRNRSVVAAWTSGLARPGWDVLCGVSYVYQIPLSDLMMGEVSVLAKVAPKVLPSTVVPRQGRKRRKPQKRDPHEVAMFLDLASRGLYRGITSVQQAAEALRVNVRTLYGLVPDEAKKAAAAFAEIRRSRSAEKDAQRLSKLKSLIEGATIELLASKGEVTRRALAEAVRAHGVTQQWSEYRVVRAWSNAAASKLAEEGKTEPQCGLR